MKNPFSNLWGTPYIYLYGGATGDTIFGMDIVRLLNTKVPHARVLFLSTRRNNFSRDLVAPLSSISFLTFTKGNIYSWLALLFLACIPHKILVHEPMSSPMPLWWKIVLRIATLRRGSMEVRCTPQPTEHFIPKRVQVVGFDPRTDQIFDTIPRILNAWGIGTFPPLPAHLDASVYKGGVVEKKPYIVLHLFAPSTLRSEPVTKGRELLSAIQKNFPSHQLLLTCAASEFSRAQRMAEGLAAKIYCDLSAATLVSLIAGADVYIGVDTGITHIACHLDIPSVVLGNRSNPCWLPYYAPRATILFDQKRCGCNGDKTGDCREETPEGPVYRCLFDIPIESIIAATKNALTT